MNAQELKNTILSFTNDVCFEYQGQRACINPWGLKKYEVGYADIGKTYTDIEDVMNDPIYFGKSLNEIAHLLKLD
jgi:hypothetical protein